VSAPTDASPPAAEAAQALRGLAFVLAVPLIAANGALDAYTFLAHDRVFANAQTGNGVLFAMGLIRPDIARHYRISGQSSLSSPAPRWLGRCTTLPTLRTRPGHDAGS